MAKSLKNNFERIIMIQEDVEYNIGCEYFKFNIQLLDDLDSEYIILYNTLMTEIHKYNTDCFKQLNNRLNLEKHNKTRLSTNLKLFENDPILTKWKQNTNNVNTIEELNQFMTNVLTNYDHTYESVIHAFSYIAMAAINVANNFEQGNITGSQQISICDLLFLDARNVKGPIDIIYYNQFLYPQYSDKNVHNKIITKEVWEYIYDNTCDLLIENFHKSNDNKAHPDVVHHWESIVYKNEVPFGYTIQEDDNDNN